MPKNVFVILVDKQRFFWKSAIGFRQSTISIQKECHVNFCPIFEAKINSPKVPLTYKTYIDITNYFDFIGCFIYLRLIEWCQQNNYLLIAKKKIMTYLLFIKYIASNIILLFSNNITAYIILISLWLNKPIY